MSRLAEIIHHPRIKANILKQKVPICQFITVKTIHNLKSYKPRNMELMVSTISDEVRRYFIGSAAENSYEVLWYFIGNEGVKDRKRSSPVS